MTLLEPRSEAFYVEINDNFVTKRGLENLKDDLVGALLDIKSEIKQLRSEMEARS
jgi:DNA-binding protein YbaB